MNHGKTTILDRIRGTAVAQKEAGGITQHIGATEISADVLEDICGESLKKRKFSITVPGMLFIDTPGHEAFTTLRKRGGALADLAILVVDINEGIKPQTLESITILKYSKTPFIVAANKIDLIKGWRTSNISFTDSFNRQHQTIQQDLEEKIYALVAQLAEEGFSSERFDRITDFTKQISIVPICARSGEGLSDLLMVLTGLAQRFLREELEIHKQAKGTVLEVKKEKGMGTTLDLILYDGQLKVGEEIALYSNKGVVATKIKSLLKPDQLVELKTTKRFHPVDKVTAASGVKLLAPGIDDIIPGSPLRSVETSFEEVKTEISQEIEDAKIDTTDIGVILKADTLGTLEAMTAILKNAGIKIRRADIGEISKKDISDAEIVRKSDELSGVLFAFNVPVPPEAQQMIDDLKIKLFSGNVIYKLLKDYNSWKQQQFERQKQAKMEALVKPGIIKLLPGYVFRQSKPAVVGIEVLDGIIKSKYALMNEKGEKIGIIKEIQAENKAIGEAKKPQRVAVSIIGPTVGRQISEGDTLYVDVPEADIENLKNLRNLLSESEVNALLQIEKIKK